jgi:pimeloyl-ACP methyl ester carboxylesterase
MQARIHGHSLAYEIRGPRSAPWLIFIHGFPFNRSLWAQQLRTFSRSWRSVAYDLRGLGQSSLGTPPKLLETYVDDLLALLDHLGAARAVLVGLSMGGYIALRAAQKAPTRVAALALCDSKAAADDDAAKLARHAALETLHTQGLKAYVDASLPKLLAPSTLRRRPAVVGSLRRMMLANRPAGIANGIVAMAGRTDSTALLPTLRIPVLFLAGEEDALTPPSLQRAMQRTTPRARLVLLKGAGHVSNLESPAAFDRALGRWLKSLP